MGKPSREKNLHCLQQKQNYEPHWKRSARHQCQEVTTHTLSPSSSCYMSAAGLTAE